MAMSAYPNQEWLEADGFGGFASGTSTGIRTRRYHALLLTATMPPTGRMVLVNGFDAWAVRKAQQRYYGRSQPAAAPPELDALTDEEIAFIQARDSVYIATISEAGWPYIQHRGGRAGFLRVLNPQMLAFADYQGNRQMLSTGNLAANDRVALFLMDYPQRTRLKILGCARVEDARQHPELVEQLSEPEVQRIVERVFFIEVVSFDWNCPKYITPRYTAEEVQELVAPLKMRISALEAQLKHGV